MCISNLLSKTGSVLGGIAALGKFDALHLGHRELAVQASKVGIPFLLSFIGVAEVLGYEPRPPVVARCDRARILSSWSPFCGNKPLRECEIKFQSVRHLTPRQFVAKLSKEFEVRGIVAGQNFRFGYKASGGAGDLVSLCEEFGLEAYIINNVVDKEESFSTRGVYAPNDRGQISSTRVRYALAEGNMENVAKLLGRDHRLMLESKEDRPFVIGNNGTMYAPRSGMLNLSPRDGLYANCQAFGSDETGGPCSCRVRIGRDDIVLEFEDYLNFSANGFHRLGIDFSGNVRR